MRRWLLPTALVLLFFLLLQGFGRAGFQTLLGVGAPSTGGATPFQLDGTPTSDTGSGASFTTSPFSTTVPNGIIYIAIETNGGPVTGSPTTAGLTWTKRTSANTSGSPGQFLELWSAPSSSVLSGATTTVNTTSNSFWVATVFAFSGAHFAAPFDSNVAIPSQSSSNAAYAACTTTNATDILIGVIATTGTAAVGGSWTLISGTAGNLRFHVVEIQSVGSPQAALTTGPGGVPANGGGSICDAIIQGP